MKIKIEETIVLWLPHFKLNGNIPIDNSTSSFQPMLWHCTHWTISSKKIRDELSVYVIHQASWILIVIPSIDEEFLESVLINKWTDLENGVWCQ